MGRLHRPVAYRTMLVMRLFEEAIGEATAAGEIHGEMHLGIGQEAISAALAPILRPSDAVVSTHRPHLHALARGVDPVQLAAELLERDGLCRGKGGHMHLFAAEQQFMCSGIVGSNVPQAAGYAFAQLHGGTSGVTVAVVGDGAMQQGAFFETLNLAALWNLPLILLCEDNGYGISVRRDDAAAGSLEGRGQPFGIPGERCDGTDVEAVFSVLERAFERARRSDGQSLVVADCYRWRGHYEGDSDHYRDKAEKQLAMTPERDPIARLRASMLSQGADESELSAIETDAQDQVAAWMRAARERSMPDVSTLREDLFV